MFKDFYSIWISTQADKSPKQSFYSNRISNRSCLNQINVASNPYGFIIFCPSVIVFSHRIWFLSLIMCVNNSSICLNVCVSTALDQSKFYQLVSTCIQPSSYCLIHFCKSLRWWLLYGSVFLFSLEFDVSKNMLKLNLVCVCV